ncbi:MAG TPA: hypothetical protein VN791_04745 [Acidimicrobiales bacterium]|nr:hypothetical protein [Acidimicrobiales bacterium]
MTLGRRCDEIVRLIDEALVASADHGATAVDVAAHPSRAGLDGDGDGRTLPDDALADR